MSFKRHGDKKNFKNGPRDTHFPKEQNNRHNNRPNNQSKNVSKFSKKINKRPKLSDEQKTKRLDSELERYFKKDGNLNSRMFQPIFG